MCFAEGTAILVIPGNIGCSTVEPPPFFGRDEAELRACVTENMDLVSDLEVFDQRSRRRQPGGLSNRHSTVHGRPPGGQHRRGGTGCSANDGRGLQLIIAPPPPGEYRVKASATYAGDPYPGTYTIIVEAPQVIEPPPTT